MFRTSNPAFRNEAFRPAQTWDDLRQQGRGTDIPAPATAARAIDKSVMTLQGTVNKTGFLLTLCIGTAILGWNAVLDWGYSPALVGFGGGIAAFLVAMVCCFAPKTSPVLAPIYALLKGTALGGLSAVYAAYITSKGENGAPMGLNTELIFNAILLTFGISGGVLAGYATKLIRPGPIFRNAVVAGTIGIFFYYLIATVASFFGTFSIFSVLNPTNGGLISIGFSAFVVVLAASNLVLDFDLVNNGVQNRAPKYMEWYSGFGILVTLAWLYVEVLRLLSKLQSRD